MFWRSKVKQHRQVKQTPDTHHISIDFENEEEVKYHLGDQNIKSADLLDILNQLTKEVWGNYLNILLKNPVFPLAIQQLPENQIQSLVKELEEDQLVRFINLCELDDSAYFLSLLPSFLQNDILAKVKRSHKITQFLEFPKDTCGRLMITDFFSVGIDNTVEDALEMVRNKAKDESISYIHCLTTTKKLIGVVSLKELATSELDTPLDDIVNRQVVSVYGANDIEEAVNLIKRYDFVTLPVINQKKRMIGIITVDDVLDIIESQATADIYAQAGLQVNDSVGQGLKVSYFNRAPWLVFNLVLAWGVSLVIHQFELTLSKVILLASLMHIAAAIAGNTAIQTLTVTTRALATGEFDYINKSKAIWKEISLGVLLGMTTGFFGFIIVSLYWEEQWKVGLILMVSMMLNSFVAALFGTIVPLILKSLGRDPAVSSGVFVTTATDVFSFFSFLGLATLGLKYFV